MKESVVIHNLAIREKLVSDAQNLLVRAVYGDVHRDFLEDIRDLEKYGHNRIAQALSKFFKTVRKHQTALVKALADLERQEGYCPVMDEWDELQGEVKKS